MAEFEVFEGLAELFAEDGALAGAEVGEGVAVEEAEVAAVNDAAAEAEALPNIVGNDAEAINAAIENNPLAKSNWEIATTFVKNATVSGAKFIFVNAVIGSIMYAVTLGLNKLAAKQASDSGGSSRMSLSDYIDKGMKAGIKNGLISGLNDPGALDYKKGLAKAAMLVPALVDLTQ